MVMSGRDYKDAYIISNVAWQLQKHIFRQLHRYVISKINMYFRKTHLQNISFLKYE